MKSVISYTLSHCSKCMKCLRICPTKAITMENNRVNINREICINCGLCVDTCMFLGLHAKGSTIYDLENYNYKIAIVPSALIGVCKNKCDVNKLYSGILKLGFDEVYDLSSIEGTINEYNNKQLKEGKCSIKTNCPVISKLIKIDYPALLTNTLENALASEIAAKKLRVKHQDKQNVGIFYLCECMAKLAFAKYPYGNNEYEVDHALSLTDIFPKLNKLIDDELIDIDFNKYGLKSCIKEFDDNILNVDGLPKTLEVLEMMEFGLLEDYKGADISFCLNGCAGANFLWSNRYLRERNIHKLLNKGNDKLEDLRAEDMIKITKVDNVSETKSMMDKLIRFNQLNQQLENLPELDCGACGYASCRLMAEAIVDGKKKIDNCKIINTK